MGSQIVNPVQTGNAWQVQLATQPQTTQYTFRQLWQQILQYNPDVPVPLAKQWVNNSYRRVVDRRLWYGLMVKGVLNAVGAYATGSVTVANGSTTVTGNGTAFTTAMIGLQFRTGYQNPIYTIADVDVGAQTLTLDLPWGGSSLGTQSYNILQMIVSLGPAVKRVLTMVNQQQGYRIRLGVSQDILNYWDTWRTQVNWTYVLAQHPPAADGSPLWELYPAPNVPQSFPFMGYNQPADMVNDGDYPASFVRGDIIVAGALTQALLYRGRGTDYVDPASAAFYQKYFESEMVKMELNDDNQYGKDFTYDPGGFDLAAGQGSIFAQSHAFSLWEGY